MADSTQSYDDLAACYDQMFQNWGASIARQAEVPGAILHDQCGDGRPIRVLDCACGIGTQSLGLAMKDFGVTGCDISFLAIRRARSEAAKRSLQIPFLVANMMQLSAIPDSNFHSVICMDNSLPHLETDEQLLQAAQQAYGKLTPGGSFIGSIRDYDRLLSKGRKSRARTSIRTALEGGLSFKSGTGQTSGAIASISTLREAQNLHGTPSISPRLTGRCFGVS